MGIQDQASANPPTIVDVYLVVRRRWWLLLSVVLITLAGAFALAYLLPPTYRSQVTLAPTEPLSGQTRGGAVGALSALRSLAAPTNDVTAEAIAILESRRFTDEFIRKHSLTDELLADERDASRGNSDKAVEDAALKFSTRVRSVVIDDETGFVTLRIDWRSADEAQQWAAWLVADLDREMKRRAKDEAQRDLIFLQQRLRLEQLPEIRNSLIDLVRDRMEREMFASRPQFAFRVIDPPSRSHYRNQPQRTLIIVGGAIAGLLLGLAVLALVETVSRIRTHV